MGLWLGTIAGDAPTNDMERNIETGFIWVVGRLDPDKDVPRSERWHIQGIAVNEQSATAMCLDKTYFIGPLPIGVALPHERSEWIGAYFPLLQYDAFTGDTTTNNI